MFSCSKIPEAFQTYRETYRYDEYKPRGKKIWRDYKTFWAVFDNKGTAYPLKYIYEIASGIPTPDFKTGEAQRELEQCGYECRII